MIGSLNDLDEGEIKLNEKKVEGGGSEGERKLEVEKVQKVDNYI